MEGGHEFLLPVLYQTSIVVLDMPVCRPAKQQLSFRTWDCQQNSSNHSVSIRCPAFLMQQMAGELPKLTNLGVLLEWFLLWNVQRHVVLCATQDISLG